MTTFVTGPPSPPISKEVLEELTGCPVLTYLIEDGSKPGDNFMSVIYSVTAELVVPNESGEEKELHYFIFKCYPRHPARQGYFNGTNMFYNELCFYKVWAKTLCDFQMEVLKKDKVLELAFPPFIGGRAIDFSRMEKTEIAEVFQPLDNFIVMTDLRSQGFQMVDKAKGLDFEHLSLALTELAKMHALSWAYQSKVEKDILQKFPFLRTGIGQKDMEMWGNIVKSNLDIAIKAMDSFSKPELSKGTEKIKENIFKIVELFILQGEKEQKQSWKFHRSPPEEMVEATVNEEPWRVICHGDSWSNNLLFKYEPSGKPEEVIIFDFQLARNACPTVDLSYLIYTSTTPQFRKEYLERLLKLYVDKFTSFCNHLEVPLLPGFSLESLKMRFHRSKILGYMMAVIAFPNVFLKKDEQVNLEHSEEVDMEKMFSDAFGKGALEGSEYPKRIVELAQELYDEGVL